MLIALVALSTSAIAGNGHSYLLGNQAAITGGAVTAITADGAALWYNPAGLAANDRNKLDISGSAFVLRIRDYPKVFETKLPESTEFDDLSGVDFLSVPSALAYVRRLSDDVQLGFGLFVPELDASSVQADTTAQGSVYDFAQQFEIESQRQVYYGAVGVGIVASDTLRLGLTLGLFYASGSASTQLWWDVGTQQPSAIVILLSQEVSSARFGLQLTGGAQLDVTDDITLGLNVRSPALQLYETVTASRLGIAANVSATDNDAALDFVPVDRSEFNVGLVQPVSATLAVAYRLSPTTFVAAEFEFVAGLDDDATGVERESTWNARVGAQLALDETSFFGIGLFSDRSDTSAPSEFGDKQVDFYGVALGVDLSTPLNIRGGDRADGLIFTSTFGLRYAFGSGKLGGQTGDFRGLGVDPPPRVVDITEHEISLHIGSGLLF